MSTFADLLRAHRARVALTQEELAERAGLTVNAVGALERGERRRPYPHTVRALAAALGLDDAQRERLVDAVPQRVAPRPPDPVPEPAPGSPRPLAGSGPVLGREDVVSAVGALVRDATRRMVTLVGPGGVGKTTVALAVADAVADRFPGGVVLVELAGLLDAGGVVPAIAAALDVPAGHDGSAAAVARRLAGRRVLLVLDNVEHVLDCATELATLVEAAPDLVLLATSRAPLRLRAEREVRVVPLDLADSIRLFRERVVAAGATPPAEGPGAAAVRALCERADGLPLVVELAASAAARVGPAALLDRLDAGRQPLAAPRDLPARQLTMAASLVWSHDLLGAPARALLARLSVCVGGFTVELAGAVVDVECADVLPALVELLEHSLVVAATEVEGVERFRMLEPVRQEAACLLTAAGRDAALRGLARAVLEGARLLAEDLRGAGQAAALRLLEADLGNLRVAFEVLLAEGEVDGESDAAELLGLLAHFLPVRGHGREGRGWAARLRPRALGDRVRARVLTASAALENMVDPDAARRFADEGHALAHHVGDAPLAATAALLRVATSFFPGDLDAARAALAEAERDVAAAPDPWLRVHVLLIAGQVASLGGDRAAAERTLREAEAAARRLGAPTETSAVLVALAIVAEADGRDADASSLLVEAVDLGVAIGNRWTATYVLSTLAGVALRLDEPVLGVRLASASSAHADEHAVGADFPTTREARHRDLATARAALGEDAFARAWAAGRGMALDEALGIARTLAGRAGDGRRVVPAGR